MEVGLEIDGRYCGQWRYGVRRFTTLSPAAFSCHVRSFGRRAQGGRSYVGAQDA